MRYRSVWPKTQARNRRCSAPPNGMRVIPKLGTGKDAAIWFSVRFLQTSSFSPLTPNRTHSIFSPSLIFPFPRCQCPRFEGKGHKRTEHVGNLMMTSSCDLQNILGWFEILIWWFCMKICTPSLSENLREIPAWGLHSSATITGSPPNSGGSPPYAPT